MMTKEEVTKAIELLEEQVKVIQDSIATFSMLELKNCELAKNSKLLATEHNIKMRGYIDELSILKDQMN